MERVRQGIGKRLLAAVLDAVVLVIVNVAAGLLLWKLPYVQGVVSSAFNLAYLSSEVFLGRTPGKMVLKLMITNLDGTPAGQATLLERFAIKNAASIVTLVAALTGVHLLGLLAGVVGLAVVAAALMMLRPDRLAGYDLVAGTAVMGPTELEFAIPTAAMLKPAAE